MRKRGVIENSEAVATMTEAVRPQPRQSGADIDVDDLPAPSDGVPVLTRPPRDSTVRGRRARTASTPTNQALRERVLSRRRRWRR
jgi:hypothetical protein